MPYKDIQKKRDWYNNWYAKNGRNRAIDYCEAIIEWQIRHPEALKAIQEVAYALKTGKLVKPKECSQCGREVRLSAHHEDYSNPLKVVWLCSSCHKFRHQTGT